MGVSEFLVELTMNKAIIAFVIAWFIAQVLKTFIHLLITKKFALERMIGSGGMPSSHSASVCALATYVAMANGANSVEFAIAISFAMVIMHDATGVRREAGNHAKILNKMIESFKHIAEEGDEATVEEKLKEFVGHTPLQVFAGAILGIVVGVIVGIN